MRDSCIAQIEPAGPKRRARLVRFDDGESILTSASIVRALDLETGQPQSLKDIAIQVAELEHTHANERALWLLGYRDRSRAELHRELSSDGFSESVVTSVVARLVELSLIDEHRFAFAHARSRAAGRRGGRAIERELRQRGIDPETARAAAAEALGDDEVGLARAVIARTPLDGRANRERALRRLIRRGFGMKVALEALSANEGK